MFICFKAIYSRSLKLQFTNDFVFYTIQGEGKYIGSPSVFIRLSLCNLRCEWRREDGKTNLCDTAYSSHHPENLQKSIDDVMNELKKYPQAKHVVITGGEPFLQKDLAQLVSELKKQNLFITIETNGTIYFSTEADFISLSPKLASSCVSESLHFSEHQKLRYQPEALASFINHHECQLKFVVNSEEDLEEIKRLQKDLEFLVKKSIQTQIYLMPQGISKKEIEEKSLQVIDWAKREGYHYTDRMHIRIWGPKRRV